MIKRKSYLLFLIPALIFVGLCIFDKGNSIFDINIHDTYYVVANRHFHGLLFIIFVILFGFYWSLDKAKIPLIAVLSKIHIYGTLLSTIGLIFPYSLIFDSSRFPLYDDMQYVNICLSISGLLFLFLQVLFIINIFVALIKYTFGFMQKNKK